MAPANFGTVSVAKTEKFVSDLFLAAGLSPSASARIASALIEADMSGRASHGILQSEAYLARLMAGSMTTNEAPEIVSENGGVVVLDGANMQGHLAAEAAIEIGIKKAREFGISAVSVRNGFHIGVAGRYARIAAENGCVGFVMCNTKPVMASPGGAEPLLGTNPLAIGLPAKDGPAIVFDMATTSGTVGKIRQALSAGEKIPADWATDQDGNETTDPAVGINGILLPMSGHKGFGLAFVIDLISGLLSSGGWGPNINGMRGGDLSQAMNSAHLFILLDIAHFRSLDGFLEEARQGAERLRNSRKAEGTDRLYTPGERSALALSENDGQIKLTASLAKTFAARAELLGVEVPDFVKELIIEA